MDMLVATVIHSRLLTHSRLSGLQDGHGVTDGMRNDALRYVRLNFVYALLRCVLALQCVLQCGVCTAYPDKVGWVNSELTS